MDAKKRPRLSHPTLLALRALLKESPKSGAELTRETGSLPGTIYPMLKRLQDCGWISSKWESGDPSDLGRPLRCLYSLTATGRAGTKAALAELART